MESPHIVLLRDALGGTPITQAEIRDALQRVDRLVADLAGDLQVSYAGPFVGPPLAPEQHQLCVREHHWPRDVHAWGVALCSTHPTHAGRADWRLGGVSRDRLPIVLQALPAFFAGYAQSAADAGMAKRGSCRRLREIAHALALTGA